MTTPVSHTEGWIVASGSTLLDSLSAHLSLAPNDAS